MSKEVLIRNVKVVLRGNYIVSASIYVRDGRIASIVKEDSSLIRSSDVVIEGRGLLALPGFIDIHAHIYDPDYTHHEDFKTGSTAALYGGITTFFDMPLRMYVEDRETLRTKVDEGRRNSLINFGILAGMMNEGNLGNVPQLRAEGVKGFKLFTCKPFRPKLDGTLSEVIKTVSNYGGVTIIHAEDDALIEPLVSKLKSQGVRDPIAHHLSRPPEAEASAINRVVNIAKFHGAEIHIAHVSSRLGAEEVRRGKEVGVKVTAETCPQYLYFTREDVIKWGNYLKITPSLKSRADVEALWKALAGGVIDAVASDHAPSTREEKEVDVWEAWGGAPVLETMFPLVFTLGVKKTGLLTLRRFIEVSSENPAKILGIYPERGALAPGSKADIVLLNPGKCFEVKADKLHHKVDWTPFEGVELCGWPEVTIVNGEVILKDGEIQVSGFRGEYLGVKSRIESGVATQ